MLNQIVVMGRLTHDPELRHTQNGVPVASFSLACERDYREKGTGEKVTDFIDVVAWRSTGEFASKYFTKGRMAIVAGRLQLRDWTDRDGKRRRSAEIVADNIYFGDSKRDYEGGGYQHGSGSRSHEDNYPSGDSKNQDLDGSKPVAATQSITDDEDNMFTDLSKEDEHELPF